MQTKAPTVTVAYTRVYVFTCTDCISSKLVGKLVFEDLSMVLKEGGWACAIQTEGGAVAHPTKPRTQISLNVTTHW